jgi:sporulation integral membrane protein YlbJ
MKTKKIPKTLIINVTLMLLLLIILILPKASMKAAERGLLLWFNVIIPTLFPFILLSNLIINSNIINYINYIFTGIMAKLFKLPGVAGYAFITGLLSGYPVGAKITADLLDKNAINQTQAQYMLTFCNNASPMFIMGFIATGLLDNSRIGIFMLVTIYTANLLTAFIYRVIYERNLPPINNSTPKSNVNKSINFSLFDDCIMNAISLIVKIGGYIIFFSIILNCFYLIPIKDSIIKNFLFSLIELSNGSKILVNCNSSIQVTFVLLCTLISFGSFSVHAQTASVLADTKLNINKYILSKTINAVITFITALLITPFLI